jgi:hypothetical protein
VLAASAASSASSDGTTREAMYSSTAAQRC